MKANEKNNPMNCEEVLHLLPLYLGGELETDQKGDPLEQIRVHVEGCAPCALELEQGSKLVRVRQEFWQTQAASESGAGAGVALRAAVLARLHEEPGGRVLTMPKPKSGTHTLGSGGDGGPAPRAGTWAPMAAAAALFLAAVGLGYQYWGSNGNQPVNTPGVGSPNVELVNAPVMNGSQPGNHSLAGFPNGSPAGSGGMQVADAEVAPGNSGQTGGLRRVAPGEESLLEEARPWGLEETPAGVMEFGRGAMKMATHEDDF